MGAFDGYVRSSYSGFGKIDPSERYFNNQSAFNFFEGFGLHELKALLARAEVIGDTTVWVPRKRAQDGSIGVSTWYVRALIAEHFKEIV